MQLFLDVFSQLSVFTVGILLPMALALVVVGSAVKNKTILRTSFFSAIAVAVLYVIIFAIQLVGAVGQGANIGEILADTQVLLSIALGVLFPVVVSVVVAVFGNMQFKKIS